MHPPALLAIGDPRMLLDGPGVPASDAPGYRLVDSASPVLRFDDLGFTRGDGAFEAATVHDGRALALAYHLRRLELSLVRLGLPKLRSLTVWRETVEGFLSESGFPAEHGSLLRIFVTAGGHDARLGDPGDASILLVRSAISSSERAEPVSATLLSRGVSSAAAREAPWLLLGVKTLSYATNLAMNRWAASRGAELAIQRTTDGFVLEGPQSTIVARRGDTLFSPHPEIGILHGTTQAELFRYAGGRGLSAELRPVTVDELLEADSVYTLGGGTIRGVSRIDDREFHLDQDLIRGFSAFLSEETTYQSDWESSAAGFPLGAP